MKRLLLAVCVSSLLLWGCSLDGLQDSAVSESSAQASSEQSIQDSSEGTTEGATCLIGEILPEANNPYGVHLKLEAVTPDEAIYRIWSDSDLEGMCGCDYWVEQWDGEKWEKLPYSDKHVIGWTDDGYLLRRTHRMICDFNWVYDSLEEGRYRLVKDVSFLNTSRDWFDVYAEFVIRPASAQEAAEHSIETFTQKEYLERACFIEFQVTKKDSQDRDCIFEEYKIDRENARYFYYHADMNIDKYRDDDGENEGYEAIIELTKEKVESFFKQTAEHQFYAMGLAYSGGALWSGRIEFDDGSRLFFSAAQPFSDQVQTILKDFHELLGFDIIQEAPKITPWLGQGRFL